MYEWLLLHPQCRDSTLAWSCLELLMCHRIVVGLTLLQCLKLQCFSKQRTVHNTNRCSCIRVGKDTGQNATPRNVHSRYSGEHWCEIHWQASSKIWKIQKLSTVWTFSCTACVVLCHQQWDEPEDLVDTTREKFKKVEALKQWWKFF